MTFWLLSKKRLRYSGECHLYRAYTIGRTPNIYSNWMQQKGQFALNSPFYPHLPLLHGVKIGRINSQPRWGDKTAMRPFAKLLWTLVIFTKLCEFALYVCIRSISLSEAADILESQLGYDRAKAEHFVKQFDRNNDGQLCAAELDNFKTTVRDT